MAPWRMQIILSSYATRTFPGMWLQLATGVTLVRQEGFWALYSGLVPALTRGLLYGGWGLITCPLGAAVTLYPIACPYKLMPHGAHAGARLGTYSPIKAALGGDKEHNNLFRNIAAGCLSGGFAAAVTNPIDLIKTRLQAKGSPYRNAWHVVRSVVAEQGIAGLWAGTTPSVVGDATPAESYIVTPPPQEHADACM